MPKITLQNIISFIRTNLLNLYVNRIMDTKLTLKLDQEIIEKAKTYALLNKTSLSKLIENYLQSITDKTETNKITPLVKSLSGILDLPGNFDHKNAYKDHLSSKYK